MRTSIENWILTHWYSTQTPPWYLRSLEPLYRIAWQRARKRQLARIPQHRTDVPLIIVGNITAGGSGKTPMVIRLCELATELGLKAGIASTGYGRQSRDTQLVASKGNPLDYGDEPVLLAQRTGVPVVVAAKRRDAVQMLNTMALDLIISDDGLQHLDLGADIEICMVDGQRGLGNGHMIPAGPLREPATRLKTVNHVVSNGIWENSPAGLAVELMTLEADSIKSLDDSKVYSLDEFQHIQPGQTIHAFAGIGNPKRFFEMLSSKGIAVEKHARSDHHLFTSNDFNSVPQGSDIVMTEKDAVKCRTLGLKNAWYIPVETRLSTEFERILKNQLINLTKERTA